MKLDLNTADKLEAEGIWVEYDKDVSFKIRGTSPKIVQKIRSGNVKKKWRNNQRVEDINDDKYETDLWDYLIEDWKGIYLGEGEAKPTRENKKKLAELSTEHANFVLEYASDISNFVDQDQEDKERKNLETSSSSG